MCDPLKNMASLNIDEIDLSWEKILSEYPPKDLPDKLNARTGKAKNCLFEQIDLNLYEEKAKIVTFHTDIKRIHPWIKTLHVFYYDFLGEQENLSINWHDEPKEWTDRNHSGNSIIIEVSQSEKLQYNITFFVTTGTLRVQGVNYLTFVNTHFPILKQILTKVINSYSVLEPMTTDHSQDSHGTDENQNKVPEVQRKKLTSKLDDGKDIKEQTHVKVVDSNTNTDTCVASLHVLPDVDSKNSEENANMEELKQHIVRLESTLTTGIEKINNIQNENIKKTREEIQSAIEIMKQQTIQPKMTETKIESIKRHPDDLQLIDALKKKNQTLENELKELKHESYKEKVEIEDKLKKTKEDLDKTREELRKTFELTNSEGDMYRKKINEKNTEIEALNEATKRLRTQVSTTEDEITSLKMHIASTSSNPEMAEKFYVPNASKAKPSVILIGTSNIKNIQESKLSENMQIEKYVKYTIDQTCNFVDSYVSDKIPDLVVLHSLTNDIKEYKPEQCLEKLEKLVNIIRTKWPNTRIIISLATPRKDNIQFHTNGQILNALIKQIIVTDKSNQLFYCDHSSMMYQGNPSDNILEDDKYHLNTQGVSFLANNLKKAMHEVLEMPIAQRRRSRSRGPRGRGRGARY